MDRSSDIITVYVWGELSATKISEGDFIVMNGARVSNFGGKSLNCSHDHCKLLINPQLDSFADEITRFVDLTNCKAYADELAPPKAVTPTKNEEVKVEERTSKHR